MSENKNNHDAALATLDEFSSTETGARTPSGLALIILLALPFIWSIWQIWYSSPLPQLMGFSWINEDIAKFAHLTLAMGLAFLYFPARKHSPRHYIPVFDWALALAGSACVIYLIVFRNDIVDRLGAPTSLDVVVGVSGLLLLLEATRRALGPPLMVVAAVFLAYSLAGPHMPDVIAHKGASLNKLVSHQWFTTEGVFGVAIGVSATFVFLFVLFGSLLDKAGAGNYFIKVAFSLLGHMRGGPAKAAVVASGLSGVVSGSSIANVVTTGTFTIPLMKRVGFPGTKAGAIEVAASTNGQLTPPIMGAAAFLMVEYVGISYIEVIKHAILPALISYIALIYIVHLEAVKAGMQGLQRTKKTTALESAFGFMTTFIFTMILTAVVYYGVGWTKQYMGEASSYIIITMMIAAYAALVWHASTYPDLELDDPDSKVIHVPEVGPTVKSGLYFLLPVVLLVWCLTVERWSPGTSAFWATLFMIFIVLTHKPLMAFFRKELGWQKKVRNGIDDLIDGMISGGRNMIGIGVATAAAGIVVGTITLTGIGQVMTELVELISGGSVILMLIFTAVICIILGMGLPTTANYIVVSSLMAPVIVTLGAENGLVVPLIAVHLFVFYFGILADDTPPVGLAAFAAAAISRSDPIKTGIQGFTYDIRTAILPFMFIFNTQLLLIDIESISVLLLTIFGAITAMLVFSSATQGFWLVKNKWYETAIMLLITFAMFRPGYFWDKLYEPTRELPATELQQLVDSSALGDKFMLKATGMTIEGDEATKVLQFKIDEEIIQSDNRLEALGLALQVSEEQITVDMPAYGSQAQEGGLDWGWEILNVQVKADRPSKYWVYIPSVLLLMFLGWLQYRRRANSDQETGDAHV